MITAKFRGIAMFPGDTQEKEIKSLIALLIQGNRTPDTMKRIRQLTMSLSNLCDLAAFGKPYQPSLFVMSVDTCRTIKGLDWPEQMKTEGTGAKKAVFSDQGHVLEFIRQGEPRTVFST